jgi:hypothetical protein
MDLPVPACEIAASSASDSFIASIPVRTSVLSSPPPVDQPQQLMPIDAAPAESTPAYATRSSPSSNQVAAATAASASSVAASTVTATAAAVGSDGEEDEEELDVDSLSLFDALELLDKVEEENISTALRLQHSWTNYMIGSLQPAQMILRFHQAAESIGHTAVSISPQQLGLPAGVDLTSLLSMARFARSVPMASRSAKNFSFSLSGTFSHSAKERRRMELLVNKAEKPVLDEWIRCLDRKELWKVRRAEEAAEAARTSNIVYQGLGAGKQPAERVDSRYGELADPTPVVPAAAGSSNRRTLTQQQQQQQQWQQAQQQQSLLAAEQEEPDVVCCVCADGDCEDDNEILFCDRCDIAVHQECYGITGGIPEGEWYCAPCSLLISQGHVKISPSTPQYACAVCWQKGGAMRRLQIEKKNFKATLSILRANADPNAKPPAQLTFAHLACALFLNELFLVEPDSPQMAISGLHLVNPARFRLKCHLCKRPGGACVQCCEKKCAVASHMQCALESGLQIEIHQSTSGDGGQYLLWCDKHRTTPRKSTALTAVQSQVAGGAGTLESQKQQLFSCQVCCYNVKPLPIEGVENDSLVCIGCQLQVHRWCYGAEPTKNHTQHTRSSTLPPADFDLTASAGCSVSIDTTVANTDAAPSPVVLPPGTIPFLCRVCEVRSNNKSAGAAAMEPPECALCLSVQGALKPTVDNRWVCLVSDNCIHICMFLNILSPCSCRRFFVFCFFLCVALHIFQSRTVLQRHGCT